MKTLTGYAAIAAKEREDSFVLCKYADPTEGARENLTASEARDIAREDPSLIWTAPVGELMVTADQVHYLIGLLHKNGYSIDRSKRTQRLLPPDRERPGTVKNWLRGITRADACELIGRLSGKYA